MELAQKASTHLLNSASGSERIKLALLPHAAFQVEFVFDVLHPPQCLVSRLAPTPPPSSPVYNLYYNFGEPACCKVLCRQRTVLVWKTPLSSQLVSERKSRKKTNKNHRTLDIFVLKL